MCNDLLVSDELQKRFKKRSGCSNATCTFRYSVDYFNARDSSVHVAALDISKAFDTVSHFKLLTLLVNAGVPKWIIDFLLSWYSKLSVTVKWNNGLSYSFCAGSGVRQGDCL